MIFLVTTGEYFQNFFSGFFGTPAILIGLVALVGCLIQRKKFSEIILSTFKTIGGFLIISGGAGIISGAIQKFSSAFNLLFGVNGVFGNNDPIPGIILGIPELVWIATAGSLILILAMVLNLVLAKISQRRYIWLTGQGAWYVSTMVASVCAVAGVEEKNMWLIIIVGGLLVSMYMVLSPSLLNKHMKVITKGETLAMAHTGSIAYFIAGEVGGLVHKIKKGKVRSAEDIKVPHGLEFFKNTKVSIPLTMLIFYLIVYFTTWGVRGYEGMINAKIIDENQDVFVQGLLQAFTFGAGVEVLLIGVGMFIAEITPAFKGISDKWIKGGKPALDCPTVFAFAPNAVILGFVASLFAGIIMFSINIGISASLSKEVTWATIILPSIVPHFFTGATAGIFGNSKGGVWGCLIGAFINGFIVQLIPWIFVGLAAIQPQIAASSQIWGDADYILGIIPWIIIKFLGGQYSLLGISIAAWALVPLIDLFIHKYKMNHNETYKLNYNETQNIYSEFKDLKHQKALAAENEIGLIKRSYSNSADKKIQKEKISLVKSSLNDEKILLDKELDSRLLQLKEGNTNE